MIKRFTNGGDNVHIVENGLTIDLYDSMRRYADMKVYDKEDIAQALKILYIVLLCMMMKCL